MVASDCIKEITANLDLCSELIGRIERLNSWIEDALHKISVLPDDQRTDSLKELEADLKGYEPYVYQSLLAIKLRKLMAPQTSQGSVDIPRGLHWEEDKKAVHSLDGQSNGRKQGHQPHPTPAG